MEILRKTAIKARMGKWTYYTSSMTYEQLANYVKMPEEVFPSKVLSQRIQRDLSDKNVGRINHYLMNEEDRFFNALVLAVFGGKPCWYPGCFEKDNMSFYNIGILELSGEENIFPVDGQHRLAAIKELVSGRNADKKEEVPVIFISYDDSEVGIDRMRRLFTSLNRYTKMVNEAEKIILDEDDIVAITTRFFIDDCDFFAKKILFSKTDAMHHSDKEHFINLRSLYKCNDFLLDVFLLNQGTISESKEVYKRYRRSDGEIEKFISFTLEFWKDFVSIMPEVGTFFDKGVVDNQRSENGGSVLFRPRGICAFIHAISVISKARGKDLKDVLMCYSQTEFELNSGLWKDILWNGVILDPGNALLRDIFIFMYDESILTQKRQTSVIKKVGEMKHIDDSEAFALLHKERGK